MNCQQAKPLIDPYAACWSKLPMVRELARDLKSAFVPGGLKILPV
jgi:hypothetical protein